MEKDFEMSSFLKTFNQNLKDVCINYDPNQPRDKDGKWISGGSYSVSAITRPKNRRDSNEEFDKIEDEYSKIPSSPGGQEMKAAINDSKDTILVVDRKENKLVGAASYEVRADEIFLNHIGSIDKGSGSRILNHIIDVSKKEQLPIKLESRMQARKYWEKFNFKLKEGSTNVYIRKSD